MADVYVVVEGESEQLFVAGCVAGHLATMEVWVNPVLVGKVGGNRWEPARRDITAYLKHRRPGRPVFVSTMFDFYGMPAEWPGRSTAASLPKSQRAAHVERAIGDHIANSLGSNFDPRFFIPYVQMHELEALILAKPAELSKAFLGCESAVKKLQDEVANTPPEEINDGPQTAPSKRIINHLPDYKSYKATAAADVLGLIGIPHLMQTCPHFAGWIRKLEALGTKT